MTRMFSLPTLCPFCANYPNIFTIRYRVWGHWCPRLKKNVWWDDKGHFSTKDAESLYNDSTIVHL